MRIVALSALISALSVPAAAAPGPVAHVKNTNGWVESIAMDGPRLAYAVSGGGAGCTKVFVWNVKTRSAALVSGKGTCGADSTSTGGGVTEIAVAGTRLAWIVNLGGNTESDDSLYTSSLPGWKEQRVASVLRTGNVDGTLKGSWLTGLVGGGDRIALNRFTTDASGAVATAALQRLDVGLATIAAGKTTLRGVSLDQHRIAVLRADKKVALYDSDSGHLLLTVAPSSAREVALRQDYIVVLTRQRTLEIFNARTGAPVRTLSVAPGASRLDVHSGIAAYAVGRNVHVLRLSDGRDALLATASRAITGLEIEAPGVAYSYNTVRGIEDVGNLAFVPMRKATSALR
ncbi:MAG: hypothetical protein ACM3QU_08720 [Verrucomicrobiota bacterium]